MRLLVTGVAGFVGRHLLGFLREEHPEVEVIGVVRSRAEADGLAPEVALRIADLTQADAVAAALEGPAPDRVIHLAAQSSPTLSWTDPTATFQSNVLGLVHLLEAIRRRGLKPRVLVVGSSEEYGRAEPREMPLREEATLRPASPYAASKVAQGYVALQYGLGHGMPILRTRTFHHTGPGRADTFAESSFARQLTEIESGRRPPRVDVGNLDAVRDYTDVRDVVRAYWALLETGWPPEVYNVASGRGIRIGDLLQRLIRLCGVDVELHADPSRLRPVDLPILVGDSSKLRAATGWSPRLDLDQTLLDLLADWRRKTAPADPVR